MQLKQSIAQYNFTQWQYWDLLQTFHIANVGEVIVGSLPLQLMETRVQ